MTKSQHIVVLKGGFSPEREVSLVSGDAAASALQALGHKVTQIDAGPDLGQRLSIEKPDIVFNALHGQWGEDGCVQGMLEYLKIPYTHSGVLASALAMDKTRAKSLIADKGISVPDGKIVTRTKAPWAHPMAMPYVVKPNNQGSSVGIDIVRDDTSNIPNMLSDDDDLDRDVLVETFIPGRELTVAVMGDKPLCVTEIFPTTGFYDYDAKYAAGGSLHTLPADVSAAVRDEALDAALTVHNALGCRGLSRTDFRYDEEGDGKLYCLEINTQPGLTPTSLAPEQAAHLGISFEQLCQWMVEDASCQR